MNTSAAEKNDRLKALAGTLIFHAAIVLFFILMVFTNPDPPLYSDNSGVEVNFGYMEDGMVDLADSSRFVWFSSITGCVYL